MASPLAFIVNSRILLQAEGSTVSVTNGRISVDDGAKYLLKAYLKRYDSTTAETGAVKIPRRGDVRDTFTGGSGDSHLYRGYAISYATVGAGFTIGDDESGLTFVDITTPQAYIQPGMKCDLVFGDDRRMTGEVETSSGKFGGDGIDVTIYKEVGGIPVTIRGGMLLN